MTARRMSSRAVPATRDRIASRVKALRRARRLSQAELARRCGLHPSFIALVERGAQSMSVDCLWRVAQALDVSPESLIAPLKRTRARDGSGAGGDSSEDGQGADGRR